MVAKIGNFFESLITNLLSSSDDQLPWCDGKIVANAQAEKTCADMRVWWTLVHSTEPKDVERGIVMLEASLRGSTINSPKLMEKVYLLAVAYYRSGFYSRGRELAEVCLEKKPESRKVRSLIKAIDEQRKKDFIGIGIVVVGLIAGGMAVVAFARKK